MKSTLIHRTAPQGRRNRPLPSGGRGAPIALLFGLLLASVQVLAAEYALGTTNLLFDNGINRNASTARNASLHFSPVFLEPHVRGFVRGQLSLGNVIVQL